MAYRLGILSGSHLFMTLLLLLFLILLIKEQEQPELKTKSKQDNSNEVVIEVEKIKKVLWDAGYRFMSLMLEKNIRAITPQGDFKIYNESVITMFIPSDCVTKLDMGPFHCQVLRSKVDKKAFDSGLLSQGSKLDCYTRKPTFKSTVEVTGAGEIDGVRINNWDIYNDGKVIIHGVDNVFPLLNMPKEMPQSINEDKVEIKVDKIKKALWESGFKIMSLMMDNNLRLVIPEANFNNKNVAIVNNHSTISMFIPSDDGASFTKWRSTKDISFNAQIITLKMDKKTLKKIHKSGEDELIFYSVTSDRTIDRTLFITGPNQIECAKVIRWNIYKDERVAVHGVDDFFGCVRHWW